MKKGLLVAKILIPLFACFFLGCFAFKKVNYAIWYYSQPAGFTKEEARSLLGKQVKSFCNMGVVRAEDTKGKVVFIEYGDWNGQWVVVVDWEYSVRGKHELFWENKARFEKCLVVVEESKQ